MQYLLRACRLKQTVLTGSNAGEVEKLVPADALLLAGTCIVDEAVLTGESTPQWKAAVGTPEELTAQGEGLEHRLSIKRDKNHVLFSGTKLLQHTGDKEAHIKTPDGACLAVVLRTGFETSQGTQLASSLRASASSIADETLYPFKLSLSVFHNTC